MTAEAPVLLGQFSGAVLSDALYVWVSGLPPGPLGAKSFLVYRHATDTWEVLEAPPVPPGTPLILIAAAGRVIAFHATNEHAELPDLAYDPLTNAWAELPPDPLAPSFDRGMVWTGKELVLLGLSLEPGTGPSTPPVYRAVSMEPGAEAWRLLPDSSIVGWSPTWFWAAGHVINPSIGGRGSGQEQVGGILDVATGTWSTLPDPPLAADTYTGIAASGPEHVVSPDGFVLHVPSGAWVPLTRPEPGEMAGAATTWAGDGLFVWGGVRAIGDKSRITGTGWMWRPS